MSIFHKYDIHYGDERSTVTRIDQLKSVSNKEPRYDFFELRNIVNHALGFDDAGCETNLVELGYDIELVSSGGGSDAYKYCDYWHYQGGAVFRRAVRNNSANMIYVGTTEGIDYKKLKKQPNDWQKMILEKWNDLLAPLADDNGWIKLVIWW